MWYLKSAFDTYQKLQDAVQNRLSEVQSAILSPVDMMKKLLGSSAAPTAHQNGDQEVEALRQRVAELEARLSKPVEKKRSSKTKARRSR